MAPDQIEQARWMDDIGFYVLVTEAESHYASFKVYRVRGRCDQDGHPVLDGPDGSPVFTFDEAQVFMHGDIKWDGCSNWYFDEQDEVMLHFCAKDDAVNVGVLLGRLYEWAENLIPNWWP